MEILDRECKLHNLPVNNICTQENCDNYLLCDICINIHNKDHKYLVSIFSINNNIFEKVIEKNEENFKHLETSIVEKSKDYINKIHYDFNFILEYLIDLITKNKNSLINKIENIKNDYLEEAKIWTKLKINYSKNYLRCIDEGNSTYRKNSNFDNLPHNNDSDNLSCNISDSISDMKLNEEANDKINSQSLLELFGTINTIIDKQMYFSKITKNKSNTETLRSNDYTNPIMIQEFDKNIMDTIHEEFSELRKYFLKFNEEKLKFSNSVFSNEQGQGKNIIKLDKQKNNYLNDLSSNNINFFDNLINSANSTPRDSKKSDFLQKNISGQNLTQIKNTPSFKKNNISIKQFNRFQVSENEKKKVLIQSPYDNYDKILNKSFISENNLSNLSNDQNISLNKNSNNLYSNIDIKKITLDPPVDILVEKKGSWYTLEYIEELDYIICGYQTGEIIIFKESDLTLVKTFRPRFKKIRKLLYSSENSSIFASYDDGYIVVIYLTDFKIKHFRMSSTQIYTMEIMQNHNILIFGGVEKKISFSHVINLNKVFLYYDSKEGEIQSLLYDERRDILVSAFRKNSIIFFKYSTSDILYKHSFDGKDSCGMVLKKYKEDSILTCGYFLNIYQFMFINNEKIELVQNFNLNYLHLYDLCKLYDTYYLVTTYDEGNILIVDVESKKVVRSFEGYKGAVQIKIMKNSFYVTSHCENLKKISFKY